MGSTPRAAALRVFGWLVSAGLFGAPVAVAQAQHLLGVDVSHHQEEIDWTAVAGSGVVFVYVKATEGIDFQDPAFTRNWSGARAAGLLRGAYHMLRPEDDAVEQAKWFLKNLAEAGFGPGDLPPALDVERVSSTTSLPRHQTAERALAWLEHVEQELERKPLLYTNPRFWQDYLADHHPLTGYPLWLAEYSAEPAPSSGWGWESWTLWQFTQDGQRPGVTTRVDVNRFAGSHEELRAKLLGKP
ncbi:MAG TPA: GH25 family lysozyme [Thermoanaerobaculia bacterium]|nr:GH25 family lysozyme [Thermoanaerobaculia bacterium]